VAACANPGCRRTFDVLALGSRWKGAHALVGVEFCSRRCQLQVEYARTLATPPSSFGPPWRVWDSSTGTSRYVTH
jgi:hypothetical protein